MASNTPPLTTEQLAERWHMAPATLEVWRQRGKGPKFFKVGTGARGGVLYTIDEIERYEKERTKRSTKDDYGDEVESDRAL